ncbi:50S ribosomal protein L18 [Rhodohalobacter sp. 614A]|uniref:50S ribosomal protein L18 n=1 Tax=Rhodohalobacter sp. 614A TaxID=2908649 RepID=UPI001F42546B|nr:50S ribosomal protein L18 [Rhodohalobacter sp. 614A]
MRKNNLKQERRNKIRRRIRSTIRGTAERPRLCIFKSNKHVYLQLINDRESATILSVSTQTADLQKELKDKESVEAAKIVGKALAEAAKDKGITKAVYDRSGYKYHGIVKAAADGAREGGLDL